MTTSNEPPKIFDRMRWRHRRARAARSHRDDGFIHQQVMSDIVDRLETVTRDFETSLFYGCHGLTHMLTDKCGVKSLIHGDMVEDALPGSRPAIVAEEEHWPFAPNSFDLIVSCLTLHNSNDLVGALAQMRATIKPDGLLLAALFGEETLSALRAALYEAEASILGGVTPRVAPFASVRDLGDVLRRAGYSMPVADLDRISVDYQNPMRLFADLRSMGETNILTNSTSPMPRAMLAKTLENLSVSNATVNFDIVYLTGWAPDQSQPKPLKPGSAKVPFESAVKKL